jgi:hypothetical protein
MTEVSFSAHDLEDLGRKLDQATRGFDERDRTLLLAIVELANEGLAARQGEVVGFDLDAGAFGGGLANVNQIVVTKQTDGSSNNLFQAALGNGGGGSDTPTESLSLNFTKISFR